MFTLTMKQKPREPVKCNQLPPDWTPINLEKLTCRKALYSSTSDVKVPIPIFLYNAFKCLRERNLLITEGIFRTQGNASRIKAAEPCLITGEIPAECSAADICVLIKRFFQRISGGVFGEKEAFILKCANDPQAMFTILQSFRPSSVNYGCIVYLLSRLAEVSRLSDQNRMTVENLARVVAPSLFVSSTANNANTVSSTTSPRRSRSLVRRVSDKISGKFKDLTIITKVKDDNDQMEKALINMIEHRHLLKIPPLMLRGSLYEKNRN